MKEDGWRVCEQDLLLLETEDLVHLGLIGCRNLTDANVMTIAHQFCKLVSISLKECRGLTDVGVSALGAGCSELQSIDLTGCCTLTDVRRCICAGCRMW
jgi:hypothetical protein